MANNFSTDANCVALWNFESGALTTDSKGTNTLTDQNTVGTDTTNYKQGAASADLVRTNTEYFSITDANLNSGFPLKDGDSTKNISVCGWFRLRADLAEDDEAAIYSKYDSGAGSRSILLEVYNDIGVGHRVHLVLGYASGASVESHIHTSVLSSTTWYHVTASYQNSDKAVAIRIRDASGNVLGTDYTATATLDVDKLFVGTAPVQIGSRNVSPIILWNGQLDELIVFKDIISSAEATQISLGTYGATASVVPILMHQYRARR